MPAYPRTASCIPISGKRAPLFVRIPAGTACQPSGSLEAAAPLDRCLLLIMAVLMLQSLYTLFSRMGQPALGSIDVVVRTSAAAVFGYFLSANFAARDESPQVPLASPGA